MQTLYRVVNTTTNISNCFYEKDNDDLQKFPSNKYTNSNNTRYYDLRSCENSLNSKHDYVFMVYKDTKNQVGSNVYGIFKTMEAAENIQKKLVRELHKDGDAISISQIPLNLFISSHSDYVMKVLC